MGDGWIIWHSVVMGGRHIGKCEDVMHKKCGAEVYEECRYVEV